MRIEKPRTPSQVLVEGKPAYRVGYAQMLMLRLIHALGPAESPPKGIITATGILREHIATDLWPTGLVDAERIGAGHMQYKLSHMGAFVLDDPNTVINGKPRTAEQRSQKRELEAAINLLERQRARKARQRTAATGNGSRRTAAVA